VWIQLLRFLLCDKICRHALLKLNTATAATPAEAARRQLASQLAEELAARPASQQQATATRAGPSYRSHHLCLTVTYSLGCLGSEHGAASKGWSRMLLSTFHPAWVFQSDLATCGCQLAPRLLVVTSLF
jgi:hypothetical protein